MKCEKCGAELVEGVLFCKECGNKLNSDKRFCRECGSALSPGMKFCSNCGADVNAVDNNKIPINPYQDSSNMPPKMVRPLEPITKDKRNGKPKNTNKIIMLIIGAGCVLFIAILLLTLGSGLKKSNLDNSVVNECFDEIIPVVNANTTIEA
ncbi:MAG: zinc ribbon domain-containing protein, partial [Clostridia bacterium]|nr:zinc ribbon domain-containing protein [Clostridia bacterium]